jgi:two-component system response regulator
MHPRRRPAPSTDSAERITILLVDDDPDCRELIREAAEQCQVTKDIHEVATGEEAIDFLLRRGKFVDAPRPGLVYLDVEMPGIGGLETLKRIRAEDQLADIPVVMMTGVSCETHMKLAAELGANSYTLKPANPEQFLRTVQAATDYWLQIHQSPGHKWPQEACRR